MRCLINFHLASIIILTFHLLDEVQAETFRHAYNQEEINTYIHSPYHVSFDGNHLISDQHNQLLSTVSKLTIRDQQHTNHCFVQLFAVIQNSVNGMQRVIHGTVCWDKTDGTFVLRFPNKNNFLANFVSRNQFENYFSSENQSGYYLSPSSCESLPLEHSEFIFFHYFNHPFDFFKELHKIHHISKDFTTLSRGFIFYSSLDSCDQCQEKILKVLRSSNNNEIDTYALYFSAFPCKKSSYKKRESDKSFPVKYDKQTRSFYSKKGETGFSPSRNLYDLKKSNKNRLLYSHISI